MQSNELCVPAGALSAADENGESMAPGIGDEVELTVTGRVTRTEGGEVYVQPLSVNGQPVEDAGGEGAESEDDAAIEDEIRSGNIKGGSMALMLVLFALLVGFACVSSAADLEFAKQRWCSGTIVSNHVVSALPQQVFSVEIDNYSGSTLYLMVFDSATNQLVNATPHLTPVPIPTGYVGGKDFGAAGMPFRYGINVCLSTTPRSLTNSGSGGIVTLNYSPAK